MWQGEGQNQAHRGATEGGDMAVGIHGEQEEGEKVGGAVKEGERGREAARKVRKHRHLEQPHPPL